MIPRNQQNRKSRVDLRCPTCGMDLTNPATRGYTWDGDTYCCEGCANGTGCTCERPSLKTRNSRKIGAIEQREMGMSGVEYQTPPSGPKLKTASRYPSRKAKAGEVPKRKRSLTKKRDSTREQARGRSEFTGQMNKGGARRVAVTGTKSTPHV